MTAASSSDPDGAERVALPGAVIHDFRSEITGRDHRLFVSIPEVPAPPEGFPVLYLFDANLSFVTAAEIVRSLAFAGEARAAVVVGIGYHPKDLAPPMLVRFKDLSLPATAEWIAALPFSVPGFSEEATGGVDDFLRMVLQEIKPRIAAMAAIDPTHETLLGHSLGGLAVLRALFTTPTAYRCFAALSPSIWWGEKSVLSLEREFSHAVSSGHADPRVFLAVGGLEDVPTAASIPFFTSEAEAYRSAAANRMVGNTRDLGAWLSALGGGPRYAVSTVVFEGETHASVIPAAISRAVRFALAFDPVASQPIAHQRG